jgi:hypothetical protein
MARHSRPHSCSPKTIQTQDGRLKEIGGDRVQLTVVGPFSDRRHLGMYGWIKP